MNTSTRLKHPNRFILEWTWNEKEKIRVGLLASGAKKEYVSKDDFQFVGSREKYFNKQTDWTS